ncbi:MAG: squalene--hopene cyclase [Phycisphaerae bacterium]|nr:squalene--hopene cyclase [Phycisphaerae bacterium]
MTPTLAADVLAPARSGSAGPESAPRAARPDVGARSGGVADEPLAGRAARAVDDAVAALLAKQRTDPWGRRTGAGAHWCAELEGDSILSSEYLLMKFILGQERDAHPVTGRPEWPTLERIANQLRLSQREDGSWGQYPGAPMDLSATVKAYFCLKLFEDSTDAPHMRAARERILAAGGAERINTFSMFYLACLGQVSWDACPAIPPQIVLLPEWFPFHLRKVAAWTRTMILPLAICSALQPVRRLAPEQGIDELFVDPASRTRLNKSWDDDSATWNNFFLAVDRILKWCRRLGFTPLRRRALEAAERWILRRMDPATTEGLGAIFPPMVYVQVAFTALRPGLYTRSHPVIRQAEVDLDAFMIDEPNADPRLAHVRLQPCFSPVWDTAIALDALTEAGQTAANNAKVAEACDWLREREVRLVGDWYENLRPEHRSLRPGIDMACWAFEYRNDWYPDVDDTCMTAKALYKAGDRPGESINRETARRAVQWILAMQNDDGGWAAFDRTRDRPWMEAIPFADHNAMQDPSCSDITGRVTEAIISAGLPHDHLAIARAMAYVVRTQQPEGCWWGRWGVNYIYGTWQAVNGLSAAYRPACGERADGDWFDSPGCPQPARIALARARDWFLSIQNPDGGFGESANSYLDRALMGRGVSTASQTGWALMAMMNLLPIGHPAITRAAEWLVNDQLAHDKQPFEAKRPRRTVSEAPGHVASAECPRDPVRDLAGAWAEHEFTGTGFPKVFYLRYHLYRHSFPLKALARWVRLTRAGVARGAGIPGGPA